MSDKYSIAYYRADGVWIVTDTIPDNHMTAYGWSTAANEMKTIGQAKFVAQMESFGYWFGHPVAVVINGRITKMRYLNGRSVYSSDKIKFRYYVLSEWDAEVYAHNNLLQCAHWALEQTSKTGRNLFVHNAYDGRLEFIANGRNDKVMTVDEIMAEIDYTYNAIDINEEYISLYEVQTDIEEYNRTDERLRALHANIVILHEMFSALTE